MADIYFMATLERIMQLAIAKIQRLYGVTNRMVQDLLNQMMGLSLELFYGSQLVKVIYVSHKLISPKVDLTIIGI